MVIFFPAVLVLAVFLSPSASDCPLSGCSPSRSFVSETDSFSGSFLPKLLWSYDHPPNRRVGAGCATNGGRVVCPVAAETGTTLLSWGYDGGSHWSFSLGGIIPLPLVDSTGGVIAADGYSLVGYYSDGTPRGDPVLLYPTQGEIFDLTIATGVDVVVLLYKCGFLAAYLTNGVPHASLWLNDTVNGTAGTFIPLGNPAVTENRVYVLAAFRPHGNGRPTSSLVHLRLLAVEIARSITERIRVMWQYDFTVSGSIPYQYLNISETMCILVPPSQEASQREEKLNSQAITNISNAIVNGEIIVASVNLNVSSQMESLLVSVSDTGSRYVLNFMSHSAGFVQSLSYPEVKKQESWMFWACRIDMLLRNTLLEARDALTGQVSTSVDLNKILQTSTTVAISKVTLLQTNQTLNSMFRFGLQNSSHTTSYDRTKNLLPLLVSIVSDSIGNAVVALDVSESPNASLLWKLSLPTQDGAAVGQIATVNGAGNPLMIVTTPAKINAYLLTE